jgi:hypothetical protein
MRSRRPLAYTDIGHSKKSYPWWLIDGDVKYGRPGSAHSDYGESWNLSTTGRVDPEKRHISISSANKGEIDYVQSVFKVDFPGYEVFSFEPLMANPTDPLFDTSNPPPDPDRALGYAGVYNERRKAIRAWHVTNDAKQTIELIESGIPLLEMGGEHKDLRELGPGLYMSAVPQLWIGRATKKWEFLEHLNPMQRQVLADAIGTIVLGQRQTGYITEGEYEMANKDLGYFAGQGSVGHVLQLAGQPYNIGFWKPDFLKPLGIKPGPEPEVVEFLVQGIFAGFDNQPQTRDIKDAIKGGLSGCFLRGGLVNIAQMVVWRDDAIVGMKRVKL